MANFREIEGNSGIEQSTNSRTNCKNDKQTLISTASTEDHFAAFFKRELEKKEAIIRQVYSNNPEKLKATLEALHERYKI